MYKCVKIYGKQRTGTNYITQLIKANFNILVFQNILGWKHGLWQDPVNWVHNHRYMDNDVYVYNGNGLKIETTSYNINILLDIVSGGVLYLCMIKNPYAFISSYMKYYRKPWTDTGCIIEQCKDYNLKYSNYCQISKNNCIIIKYEDLLSDYMFVLEEIKNKYRLSVKNDKFVNINSTVSSGGKQKEKFDKKNFYINSIFLKNIPNNVQKIISNNICWELLKDFHYEPSK